MAACFSRRSIIELLLERGASVAIKDEAVRLFHHREIQAGWQGELGMLYAQSPLLSKYVLLDAYEAVSMSTVKSLLDAGVSTNSSRGGRPAIHHVLSDAKLVGNSPHEEQRLYVLRLLLDRGADIHSTDNKGDTGLHRAPKRGEKHITALLISSGAAIDARNKAGETCLDIAAL